MDATLILTIILAIFGGLGALAGTAGYLRATAAKARAEALREDIGDWEKRYEALEGDLEIETHKREAAERKLDNAENRIEALEHALQGKQEFSEIARLLRQHDERAQVIDRRTKAIAVKVGVNPA